MEDKRRNEEHQMPWRANQKHYLYRYLSHRSHTEGILFPFSCWTTTMNEAVWGSGDIYFTYTSRLLSMTEESKGRNSSRNLKAGLPATPCNVTSDQGICIAKKYSRNSGTRCLMARANSCLTLCFIQLRTTWTRNGAAHSGLDLPTSMKAIMMISRRHAHRSI